jgi:hypothetical protein
LDLGDALLLVTPGSRELASWNYGIKGLDFVDVFWKGARRRKTHLMHPGKAGKRQEKLGKARKRQEKLRKGHFQFSASIVLKLRQSSSADRDQYRQEGFGP